MTLSPTERARLERESFRRTHRDFKGRFEGRPAVLTLGPRGTTLTTLASMTDRELVAYAASQGIESAKALARCPQCGHTAKHPKGTGCLHIDGKGFCPCKFR